MHPNLQFHVIQCGSAESDRRFLNLARHEYLHEDEVLVSIGVHGSWPRKKNKQGLEGRPPKTEEAKKLGIVDRICWSDCNNSDEYKLIVKRKHLEEMMQLAQKKTRPSKGNGQKKSKNKPAGNSTVSKEIAQSQKKLQAQKEREVKPSWSNKEVNEQEEEQHEKKSMVDSANIMPAKQKRQIKTSKKMILSVESH